MSELWEAAERRRRFTGNFTVLVVEDKPEEQQKAKQTLEGLGFFVIMVEDIWAGNVVQGGPAECPFISNVTNVHGVITDFHFDPQGSKPTENPAGGLLAMLVATSYGKPVVCCTGLTREPGHGGPLAMWLRPLLGTGLLGPKFPYFEINKDWKRAGEELLRQLKEKFGDSS